MGKPVKIYFRMLEQWPREFTDRHERKRKPFKTPVHKTFALLRVELRHLNSPSAVVQAAFKERDMETSSGLPRPDRKPEHPGVIVASDTKHGALKWVCDDCEQWTDNLHAIVLTLERLRKADIYGVTKKGEQYTGWKMLPGPITLTAGAAPAMTIDQAARFIESVTDFPAAKILKTSSIWQSAYREAAGKLHADRGGTPAQWQTLQDAATLLNSFHSRK